MGIENRSDGGAVSLSTHAGDFINIVSPVTTDGGDITILADDTTANAMQGVHIGNALSTVASSGGRDSGAVEIVATGGGAGVDVNASINTFGAAAGDQGGTIGITTADGDINIDAPLIALGASAADDGGAISITANGATRDIHVNLPLLTNTSSGAAGSGGVAIAAGDSVVFSVLGDIFAAGMGDVAIASNTHAGAGDEEGISLADDGAGETTVIDAGSGVISLVSNNGGSGGDIILGRLVTSHDGTAVASVTIDSGGNVVDGGDSDDGDATNFDIDAPSGRLAILATGSIGQIISPPAADGRVDTRAQFFDVQSSGIGNIGIGNTNMAQDVEIDRLGTVGGNIDFFNNSGPAQQLTINQLGVGNEVFSGGAITDGGSIRIETVGNFFVVGDIRSQIGAGGTITLFGVNLLAGTVTAGAGDIDLIGGALDTAIIADQSVLGDLFVVAQRDLFAQSEVTSAGGDIDFSAGGGIFMDDGALVASLGGELSFAAAGDIVLGGLFTTSASANAVRVVSTAGGVIDGGAAHQEIIANNGTVTIDAAIGVGSGDALETTIHTLDLDNTDEGNVEFDESDDLIVNRLIQAAPTGIVNLETGGSLTVADGLFGISSQGGQINLDAAAAVAINAAVQTTAGDVNVAADTSVTFDATSRISSAAGNVSVRADEAAGNNGGAITMADGALVDAGGGDLLFSADGDIRLAAIRSISASGTAVQVVSSSGGVLDSGDTDRDIVANSGTVTIHAADGVGSGDALETTIHTLALDNTSSGHVQLSESDALVIHRLAQAAPTGAVNVAAGGTISLADGLEGVRSLEGSLGLDSAGAIAINAAVETAGGAINVLADTDVTFDATSGIISTSGNVAVRADEAAGNNGGSITMADGSAIDAGTGEIDIAADGNITLASVRTMNPGIAAIEIASTSGAIVDGGDTAWDIEAAAGTAVISSSQGVGDAAMPTGGSDAGIETHIQSLDLENTLSGGVMLNELDDLSIDRLLQLGDDVVIEAGGLIGLTPLGAGIQNGGGGDVELDAAGDLVFGASTTTSVTGAGKILGFAGDSGDNQQVVIESGAVLQTATGSIGQKITGFEFFAINAANGLPVAVDGTAPFSTIDPFGHTSILFRLFDPAGTNFRMRINWSDGQQDNFPGFPDPVRPDAFGTLTIQPPATSVAQIDAAIQYTLNKRYDGNPDSTNPRANVPVFGQFEFDALGEFDNGIQLFENGVQETERIVIPFSFELVVPGAGLFSGGRPIEIEVVIPAAVQEANVESLVVTSTPPSSAVEEVEKVVVLEEGAATDEALLLLVVVDVQGNESGPIQLSLDLLQGDRLLDLIRKMPNGHYRVKYKQAGSNLLQTLHDLTVEQNTIVNPEGPATGNGGGNGAAQAAPGGNGPQVAGGPQNVVEASDAPAVADEATRNADSAGNSPASTAPRQAAERQEAASAMTRWRLSRPLVGGAILLGGLSVVTNEQWEERVDQAMQTGRHSLKKAARLLRRKKRSC